MCILHVSQSIIVFIIVCEIFILIKIITYSEWRIHQFVPLICSFIILYKNKVITNIFINNLSWNFYILQACKHND